MTTLTADTRRTDSISDHSALLAPTEGYPWHSLPLDPERLSRYLGTCLAHGVGYELGAKASDLTAIPPDYHAIDCSGWVRAAVAVATEGRVTMPDGSVVQNDWCAASGLKRSDFGGLRLRDGLTRIAFIRANGFHPIGHVYLARNGRTLESFGGHGPGSRPGHDARPERRDDGRLCAGDTAVSLLSPVAARRPLPSEGRGCEERLVYIIASLAMTGRPQDKMVLTPYLHPLPSEGRGRRAATGERTKGNPS